MTPTELRAKGKSLFGDHWQSPLARALDMSDRHMRRLAAGEAPITDSIAAEVDRLVARKRSEEALEQIDRLAAEHGAPAEIRLTEGRDAVGREATRLLVEALTARGIAVEIVKVTDGADPADRAAQAAAAPSQGKSRGSA